MSSGTDNEDSRATLQDPDESAAPENPTTKKAKRFITMDEFLSFQQRVEQNEQQAKQKQQQFEQQAKQKQQQFEQQVKQNQQQIEQRVELLLRAKTAKGATTNAQFYQKLVEDNLIKFSTKEVEDFLGLEEIIVLPKKIVTPMDLGNKSSESVVQEEFERCLETIRNNKDANKVLKSIPKENAYTGPSFAGRKPDLVNYEKGHTGSIAITFFGDCKKRDLNTSNNFSDEEIGHILDMARVFMEKVGHYRAKLIVFLTDGTRWQFFKARQSTDNGEEQLTYDASRIVNDVQTGWNLLWTLLQEDVSCLGYSEPKVEGVELIDPLGRGGSATVYKGIYNEANVLVKIFRKDKLSSFQAEKNALIELVGSGGVPTLVDTANIVEAKKFSSYEKALILTPVADNLRTDKCRFGEPMDGRHMKKLVKIVEFAHGKGLVHRDIKPDNCFYHEETGFILNDWGSSRRVGASLAEWEGSVGFSVSYKQQQEHGWDEKVCDLVAVVRTTFVLFCKESPPVDSHEKAVKYWAQKFREGTVWAQALTLALEKNYEGLANSLFVLK